MTVKMVQGFISEYRLSFQVKIEKTLPVFRAFIRTSTLQGESSSLQHINNSQFFTKNAENNNVHRTAVIHK